MSTCHFLQPRLLQASPLPSMMACPTVGTLLYTLLSQAVLLLMGSGNGTITSCPQKHHHPSYLNLHWGLSQVGQCHVVTTAVSQVPSCRTYYDVSLVVQIPLVESYWSKWIPQICVQRNYQKCKKKVTYTCLHKQISTSLNSAVFP